MAAQSRLYNACLFHLKCNRLSFYFLARSVSIQGADLVAVGQSDLRKQFQEAGFEIIESAPAGDAFSLKKGPCKVPIARGEGGVWQPAGSPTLTVRGLDCRLEDRGYQQFWLHGNQRIPIRVSDLKALHKFDEEVRAILGMPSLYHESLGTRSARSAYDRLTGRPGQ